jgi:hypothetical protein
MPKTPVPLEPVASPYTPKPKSPDAWPFTPACSSADAEPRILEDSEHFEFLAESGDDCREAMAEALTEACDGVHYPALMPGLRSRSRIDPRPYAAPRSDLVQVRPDSLWACEVGSDSGGRD